MFALPRLVALALLTVYLVWGSTYFAIHVALTSFPPFMLMGTRFLAAGSLLFIFLKWRGKTNPTTKQWRDAGLVGSLILGGGMGLTSYAQQYISSGLTAVFIACSPFVLTLCVGMYGEWPNRREWMGILIGFAGALLLASGGDFSAKPIGIVALLGAIICWDLGSVLSQRKFSLAPGAMGFASEMLLGGVFLVVLGYLNGEHFVGTITPSAWFAWSYLVVAGSLGAFTAYMYLIATVPPALASSYSYVNPVIAVTLGVMFAGEKIGTRDIVAMTVILSSVLLITTARNRATKITK
ncbi:drug/metabolite exporter YedA [Solimicrobium silvestre]|uniref:Permeases of the drug/metabolite transporter (DMT) superfamily n=1 Tax=Solimicrobium silvestre TaxID=2099400 RepID=A0A2S9H017_9BURK|nr:drug/metabolite exporter YedA [Solimicrobium silvestre]PRC93325.1 Permeases of the drug/metabolite transporter (DMT) superfamily [Solimicrobium silvestre]